MGLRDGELADRRLRAVYDACYCGNYKLAVNMADKLLRKTPNWHCCMVLKALSLYRMGRQSEAVKIMSLVEEETIREEEALQAATMLYKEMGTPERIPKMYEKALQGVSLDEERGTHLFMAYVRVQDYAKQQQLAFQLNKAFNVPQYYFWGVMSLVLQATSPMQGGGARLNRDTLLTLACKYMEMAAQSGKLNTQETLYLYLRILSLQGNPDKADDVMGSQLAHKCITNPDELIRLRAETAMEAKRWAVARGLYRKLIGQNPDDWGAHEGFLNTVKREADTAGEGANVLSEAFSLVNELVKTEADRCVPRRGPFLARMELISLVAKMDTVAAFEGNEAPTMDTLLVDYFQRFGHKSCCVADMAPFLDGLEKSDRLPLFTSLCTQEGLELDNLKATTAPQLHRVISLLQIRRRLQLETEHGLEEKLHWAASLLAFYQKTLSLDTHLKSTEQRTNDWLIYLCAQTLLDVANMDGHEGYAMVAAAVLQHGLAQSKYNFNLRLPLVCLLRHFGAVSLAYRQYLRLDIKNIQMETLSHLLGLSPYLSGQTSLACSVNRDIIKFHLTNQKETPECTIAAYKNGTFSKIEEFIGFKARLDKSMVQANAKIENIYATLLLDDSPTNSLAALDDVNIFDADGLKANDRDNRDFEILQTNGDAAFVLNSQCREEAKETLRLWLCLRCEHLLCIQAANHGDSTRLAESVLSLESKLDEALRHTANTAKLSPIGPEESYFELYKPFALAQGSLLKPFVYADPLPDGEELVKTLAEAEKTLDALLLARSKSYPKALTDIIPLFLLIETLNTLSLLTATRFAALTKQKKKKNQTTTTACAAVSQWVTTLKNGLGDVQQALQDMAANQCSVSVPLSLPSSLDEMLHHDMATLCHDISRSTSDALLLLAELAQLAQHHLVPKK